MTETKNNANLENRVIQIKKASRKQARIKMLIAGPSGSGKTYSSLLLASGMTDWKNICVIDTERGSADLYSQLGAYNTLTLDAPYSPERYIEAITLCINTGMQVIIIDSITHEWDGKGGILEMHDAMTGNSYVNWAKFTPRHNKFIDTILQSPVHIICTGRAKQDYVLSDKNGKQVPEKIGMKTITREGFDYEVTLGFDLDIKHNATSTKDRTGLFIDKPAFVISSETGKTILDWCNSGEKVINNYNVFLKEIKSAKDTAVLTIIGSKIGADVTINDREVNLLRLAYKEKITELSKAALPTAPTNVSPENNGEYKMFPTDLYEKWKDILKKTIVPEHLKDEYNKILKNVNYCRLTEKLKERLLTDFEQELRVMEGEKRK